MNRRRLYQQAIRKWGETAQVMMLFEKMADLQQAICHSGRNNKVAFRCDLINEIADVEIMVEQITVLLGIKAEEIYEKKKEKLIRLQERVRE